MFQIDTTIHLSDVVLVGGGIAAFLKAFVWQRDINRDVLRILKGEGGTNGLLSEVSALKHNMYETTGIVSMVKHSIVTLRLGLATRGIHLHEERKP